MNHMPKDAGNFYPPTYEPTLLDHIEAFADAWIDSLCEFTLLAAMVGYFYQRFFN